MLTLGVLAVMASLPLHGHTLLTQDEALARAFPDSVEVERRTAYLDDAGLARARELAGVVGAAAGGGPELEPDT